MFMNRGFPVGLCDLRLPKLYIYRQSVPKAEIKLVYQKHDYKDFDIWEIRLANKAHGCLPMTNHKTKENQSLANYVN